MLKKMFPLIILGAALLLAPAMASADLKSVQEMQKSLEQAKTRKQRMNRIQRYRKDNRKFVHVARFDGKRATPVMGVPELDPKGMTAAVTLLIGGVLVLADRRRRALQR